jgi:hypothetical protein
VALVHDKHLPFNGFKFCVVSSRDNLRGRDHDIRLPQLAIEDDRVEAKDSLFGRGVAD